MINRPAEALAAGRVAGSSIRGAGALQRRSYLSATYGLNIRSTRCLVNIHMQLAMDGETIGPVIIAALQTEHAAIGNHSIRDEVAERLRSPAAGVVTGQTCRMPRHKALNH